MKKPTPFQHLRDQRDASLKQQLDKTSLEEVLKRAQTVNKRFGFLAWDPEKLAQNPVGDPGPGYPRLTPPTAESPRLFISYSWSRDEIHRTYESDLWVDAFAGWLFGRGYNIWFDRDPRNLETGLNWFQVLTRMNDCNYFIPIITDQYIDRVTSANGVGPLVAEWKHAQKLFPNFLTFVGIRRSGSKLPEPLTVSNTVDVRDNPAPWSEPLEEMFPVAAPGRHAIPRLPPPDRPPDPPHWPKFQPY